MLKGLFDVVLKGITARWDAGGPGVRLALVGALALALFAASRIGGFGEGAQRLSRAVVPFPLPVLDAATPAGRVLVRADIAVAEEGWTELIPGDACPSGSRVRLVVEATEPGWIAAFGLAESGPYPLYEEGFGPIRIEDGAPLTGGAQLDDELGVEVFGVLYSQHSFPASEIEGLSLSHEAAVATVGTGKGGNLMSAFGPLSDGMVGRTLFCRHTV